MRAPAETRPASFGELLRELRLASGLSQEALAELAHMSSGGISVLERGARRAPQRDTVTLLANALQLSNEDRSRFEQAAHQSGTARRRGSANAATEVGNLPYTLTSFIGRERTIVSLRANILEYRLVTVSGVGGVGKTRLAIEAARAVGAQFEDGIWLVELAPVSDATHVGPRIAAVLGISADGSRTGDDWIDDLSERSCLIVLDNCEHVLSTCAAIAKSLLERCARVHVLATSREPLHVTGERVVRLDPLTELQAVELFIDRARNAWPEFQSASSDETALRYVQSICKALNGIPLALELAAARVPALSLKTIAQNLDKQLSLLRQGDRSALPRQQTMRALIDWSYDLLSDEERRVFNRLSVFAGGCGLDAALPVCAGDGVDESGVLDILTSLVDKSLIVVDVHIADSRYGMLEITRQYAREKLLLSGEFASAAKRHALAYLELARSLENRESIADAIWIARAEPELENWRAALQWSLNERNDAVLGQQLAAALFPVWMQYAAAEGREWVRAALAVADEAIPMAVRAKLQYAEALFALRAGENSLALASAMSALPEYRQMGDATGVVKAEKVAGMALVYMGRVDEGEPLLHEALEGSKQLGEPILTASIEDCLGSSRSMLGDFEGAKTHFARALALYLSTGSERDALYARVGLAEAYFRAQDPESALRMGTEALERARALADAYLVMAAAANVAGYALTLNRFDEARTAARESVELASRSHFEVPLTSSLAHLAAASVFRMAEESAAPGHFAKWARILGFVQARLKQTDAQRDLAIEMTIERTEDILRRNLDAEEFSAMLSAGTSMTLSSAVAQALRA